MFPSIGTAVLPVVTQFPSAVVKKRLLIEFPVRLKYEMSAFVLVDVLRGSSYFRGAGLFMLLTCALG